MKFVCSLKASWIETEIHFASARSATVVYLKSNHWKSLHSCFSSLRKRFRSQEFDHGPSDNQPTVVAEVRLSSFCEMPDVSTFATMILALVSLKASGSLSEQGL